MILKWLIGVIIHLDLCLNHQECTPPRMNSNVNYGLEAIMMCLCINCNKCTTLVGHFDNGESYACVGEGVYRKSLYLLYFAVNLKLL